MHLITMHLETQTLHSAKVTAQIYWHTSHLLGATLNSSHILPNLILQQHLQHRCCILSYFQKLRLNRLLVIWYHRASKWQSLVCFLSQSLNTLLPHLKIQLWWTLSFISFTVTKAMGWALCFPSPRTSSQNLEVALFHHGACHKQECYVT